ncbi:class I SAM-dependent methyltransferase [Shimia ponticola]|uniref:class I SAM-dependent methyltransferase n=1 Tax=Shimia ponticola TaxID=2582893 RepID=UPI0011BD9C51|nr:class I SAM-dependent methyltransferase [Shimia ponticola]
MEEISYTETHKVQSTHWWYQGRLAILTAVFDRYLTRGSDARILEIGAGSGVNIPLLQEFGQVEAVEMHPGGRAMIAERFEGVDVRDGALPDAAVFAGQTYDVVGMFDVLEHVEPHVEALVAIRENLSPDGRLFLTVPAYQWLWSQHDEAMHHFRRYNADGLRSAFEEAGWQVEQVGYFNTILFPLALIARLKDRILRPAISSGMSVPSGFVNRLFHRLFASEARRVAKGGYPFGLSLMVVAKPQTAAQAIAA